MIGKICAVVALVAVFYSFRDWSPIVQIPSGKIRGEIKGGYVVFKGIPYAEPPVGKNKIEPPKPFNSKWDGIRDGTIFSEQCMQWHEVDNGSGNLRGGEDCLYLNVYTPSIESNELYPVMFVIHGGSFMFGTGNEQDPARIMESGKTVIVTINYRLGPLGFLSTGDKELPGNMGLKDQNLAMQWVKKNIHIFKGNSAKITLTGFSAGGASVHYHMLSPKSRGLFHVAVSHSGVSFCAWASVKNYLKRTKKLGAHIGCPTDNTKQLRKCLQQKDAKEIVSAVPIFHQFMSNPFTVFGPTVEPTDSPNAFLTEDVETIIKNGKSAKVPWIIGFVTDEGGYNAAYLLRKDSNGKSIIDSLGEKWPNVAGSILFFNETVPADTHAKVAQDLKRHYLKDEEFSVKTYRRTQKMVSEQQYLLGIEKAIKLHVAYSDAPVFIYRFNRPLPYGLGKAMAQRDDVELGNDLYPVIIHIHGGAFMFGNINLYDPLQIMETGKFVVVSLNYRLGPLGFLSTEDNEISGNMGLKDQLLAIKWVKENIKMFKGDPEQIILTGFSAGGASVHYHLLSPKSHGLFKVAISHSGTAHCAWASINNPLERAKKLAVHLSCPTDNTKLLKECLKQKNASDIVSAVKIFQPFMYNPFTVFGPTIETPDTPDAFISENLESIIRNSKSAKIPWIVAFTTDEGGYNAANFLKKGSDGNAPIDSFGEKWSQLAPLMLFYNELIPAAKHAETAQKIKEKYLGSEDFSTVNYRKMQKMFTDILFLNGIGTSITLHARFNNTPLFVYRYNRPLTFGAGQLMAERNDIEFGTVHGDDFYLLFTPPFIQPSSFTEDDTQISKKLINLYDSFVKTGLPKYGELEIPATVNPNRINILQINGPNDYKIIQSLSIIEP